MITVGKYRNLGAADMDRMRLAGHGIEAVVADSAFATAGYGGMVVSMGDSGTAETSTHALHIAGSLP